MRILYYLTNRIRHDLFCAVTWEPLKDKMILVFMGVKEWRHYNRLKQSIAMSRRILRDMEKAAAIYNLFRGLLT